MAAKVLRDCDVRRIGRDVVVVHLRLPGHVHGYQQNVQLFKAQSEKGERKRRLNTGQQYSSL